MLPLGRDLNWGQAAARLVAAEVDSHAKLAAKRKGGAVVWGERGSAMSSYWGISPGHSQLSLGWSQSHLQSL